MYDDCMLQAAPPNADLVSGLVSKVVSLEAANAALTKQLQALQQQQQQQIQHSSEPQQLLHNQQQSGTPGHAACQHQQQQELQNAQQQVHHLQLELQRLRQQCKAAWQQVAEMKGFLNDYGLVWVGQPAPLQLETEQECCSTACGADACTAYCNGMYSPSSLSVKRDIQLMAAPSAAAAAAAGTYTAVAQLPFDVSELQECLDELNQLAGDGIGQLKQLQLRATPTQLAASPTNNSSSSRGKALHLVTPDPVKLMIFKDGLVLHQCPPLLCSSAAADGILSDIFDGYFPSALRGEFPDGIPIQLVDRSSQTLADATAAAAAGQKGSNIIGWQDLEQQQLHGTPGLAALSGQAFLDRLPKTVIRNQQVVSVRPVVEQYINGSSSSGSSSSAAAGKIYIRPSSCSGGLARTASQAAAAAAAAAVAAGQQSSAEGTSTAAQQQQQQQATIQVKSEDGKQTYVLMLSYTATIAALRASIDKHRASAGSTCHLCQQQQQQHALAGTPASVCSPTDGDSNGGVGGECSKPNGSCSSVCRGYELRSAFPAKLYADGSVSLEQAGLVPSATLFMRHAA
jgi:hypothetical protein